MKPEEAAQTIRDKAPAYGEAKAQRVYLEEFRKSQKALLMRDALEMGFEAANAQEREAYADPVYAKLLRGLAAAIEKEETLSDWRERPLSNEQVIYAENDVIYLYCLRQKLHQALTENQKLEIFLQFR